MQQKGLWIVSKQASKHGKPQTCNYICPWGHRATIAPGRSETEELQHSPPCVRKQSSQLLCLVCLTSRTEPVLLGFHGEWSQPSQRQMSKNSSRVGIIFFVIILELRCCISLFNTEKISFPQKAICLKGSAQVK